MNPTRIIALGGVEEIGKSTLLVEHLDHIFIIDAGIKFADTYNTGVKGIIPNYSYLKQKGKKNRRPFYNTWTWRSHWWCGLFS